jgi:hypothetical protein
MPSANAQSTWRSSFEKLSKLAGGGLGASSGSEYPKNTGPPLRDLVCGSHANTCALNSDQNG